MASLAQSLREKIMSPARPRHPSMRTKKPRFSQAALQQLADQPHVARNATLLQNVLHLNFNPDPADKDVRGELVVKLCSLDLSASFEPSSIYILTSAGSQPTVQHLPGSLQNLDISMTFKVPETFPLTVRVFGRRIVKTAGPFSPARLLGSPASKSPAPGGAERELDMELLGFVEFELPARAYPLTMGSYDLVGQDGSASGSLSLAFKITPKDAAKAPTNENASKPGEVVFRGALNFRVTGSWSIVDAMLRRDAIVFMREDGTERATVSLAGCTGARRQEQDGLVELPHGIELVDAKGAVKGVVYAVNGPERAMWLSQLAAAIKA